MCALLGHGFSGPEAPLFVEEGKGLLGDAKPHEPLPPWLSEASVEPAAAQNLSWPVRIDRRIG